MREHDKAQAATPATLAYRPLYQHAKHPHTPQNANELHKAEHVLHIAGGGIAAFNLRFALWLVAHIGTMGCFWIFCALGTTTLLAVFGAFGAASVFIAASGAALSSYELQLVLLPGLMVGQNLQARHGEIVAEQMFHNTVRLLHEHQQAQQHLNAQDVELQAQSAQLAYVTQFLGAAFPMIKLPTVTTPPAEASTGKGKPPVAAPRGRGKHSTLALVPSKKA